jgi:hypothetical protein
VSTDEPLLRTYRLGNGRAIGYVVVVISLALAVQALWVGEGTTRWSAVSACVAIACAGYLLGIRPQVSETTLALEVRNPVRSWRIYWSSVTKVDADDVVRVHAGDAVVRCFALPRRDRRPMVSGVASMFGGRKLPDDEPVRRGFTTLDVIESIEDRSRSLRGGNAPDGPPEETVEQLPLLVLVVGAVNVLAFLLLLVLG